VCEKFSEIRSRNVMDYSEFVAIYLDKNNHPASRLALISGSSQWSPSLGVKWRRVKWRRVKWCRVKWRRVKWCRVKWCRVIANRTGANSCPVTSCRRIVGDYCLFRGICDTLAPPGAAGIASTGSTMLSQPEGVGGWKNFL